jgi:ABC-type molybdate transport system substrate-binding protein
MNMKKITFIILVLLAVLASSCAEDVSTSALPSSTGVWRSTNFADSSLSATFEYYEFRFVTDSSLELWVKRTANSSPEKVNQTYTYTMKDNILSINYNNVITTGTIDKTKITVTEDGTTIEFVKV